MSKELKKAVKKRIAEIVKGRQGVAIHVEQDENRTVLDYNGETIRLGSKTKSHYSSAESFMNVEMSSSPDHWIWKAAAVFFGMPPE